LGLGHNVATSHTQFLLFRDSASIQLSLDASRLVELRANGDATATHRVKYGWVMKSERLALIGGHVREKLLPPSLEAGTCSLTRLKLRLASLAGGRQSNNRDFIASLFRPIRPRFAQFQMEQDSRVA